MTNLQICPPHLSDVATLLWEIQKSIFFNIIIHVLQIIYVISEEKNSNYSTALAVYLLRVICIALVLRLGHATGGTHVWTC